MKLTVIALSLALSACASPPNYTITPISLNDEVVCCEVIVNTDNNVESTTVKLDSTDSSLVIKANGVQSNIKIISDNAH